MQSGIEELSIEELENEGGVPLPDRELMIGVNADVAASLLGIPLLNLHADVNLGLLGL